MIVKIKSVERVVEESMMPDITNSQSPVLTVEEARLLLRLSRNSMYAAIARQEVPHLKIGRRILILRKALGDLWTAFMSDLITSVSLLISVGLLICPPTIGSTE